MCLCVWSSFGEAGILYIVVIVALCTYMPMRERFKHGDWRFELVVRLEAVEMYRLYFLGGGYTRSQVRSERQDQQCITRQTATTLRRAAASELTASGWPTRPIGATTAPGPALESTCVFAYGGKRKKEEC